MPLYPNECLLIGQDSQASARLAADRIVETLSTDGKPKSVALAGGSTPAVLYSLLTQNPYSSRLAWSKVHWFWGDERGVPPDHPDSNYRMAVETLLGPLHVPADHIHRMPADRPDLEAAASEYEQTIRQWVPAGPAGVPVFGLILLGVGPDGHTASLFPGSAALNESQRLVVPNYAPSQNAWRMTMTYPLLKAARQVLFLVTGSAKAEAMARILSDPPADMPAARLRESPGQVTWVMDAQAARLVAPPHPE